MSDTDMNRKIKMSLLYKFIIIIVTTITFVLAAFVTYEYQKESDDLSHELSERVKLAAERLAINLKRPLFDFDEAAIQNVIAAEMKFQPLVAVFIISQEEKSGFVRKQEGGILKTYDELDNSAYHDVQSQELKENNISLGEVKVFVTHKYLQEKLRARLMESILKIVCLDILMTCILVLFIRSILLTPLQEVVHFVQEIAKGDLTRPFDTDRNDEIGLLIVTLKQMCEKVSEILRAVKSSIYGVVNESKTVSISSEQVLIGANKQAAAAQEVSASMEQMASIIRQNADSAKETERIALKSSEDIKDGGQVVKDTMSAMMEIAEKISVIQEIARQTDMLALNAAIEAARAGVHGRGFSVVASEVRKLSERSQESADGISKLSADSVDISEAAGAMLTNLVPDIQKTAELVQEISLACNEQSSGANQINHAIQQLDRVIQQNVVTSEKLASMSENLTRQSQHLQETIGFFRIKEVKNVSSDKNNTPPAQKEDTQQPRETGREREEENIILPDDEEMPVLKLPRDEQYQDFDIHPKKDEEDDFEMY